VLAALLHSLLYSLTHIHPPSPIMLVSKLPESIQRQDEMTGVLGSSLKKIAKKIHRLELMLHNEPAEDAEAHEKQSWQRKMNRLLHYDVAKRLPTLKEVQLAKAKQQKLLNSKNGKRVVVRVSE
jgi:hypothetical protein